MMIKHIAGATRVLGKSQGYIGLPVRDEVIIDNATGREAHSLVTAWEPTPIEMERLRQGQPIYLRLLAAEHPPVMLWVGDDDARTGETPAELHNRLAGQIVAAIVAPIAQRGEPLTGALVILESVICGVLAAITKLGGAPIVLEKVFEGVRKRLPEILRNVEPKGRA